MKYVEVPTPLDGVEVPVTIRIGLGDEYEIGTITTHVEGSNPVDALAGLLEAAAAVMRRGSE